jgi:hypothetical protein
MSGYDRDLLASKIRWEGGIVSTLEYGLMHEEIDDPELSALWARLEDLYAQMRPLIVDMNHRLRASPEAET